MAKVCLEWCQVLLLASQLHGNIAKARIGPMHMVPLAKLLRKGSTAIVGLGIFRYEGSTHLPMFRVLAMCAVLAKSSDCTLQACFHPPDDLG